MAEKTLISQVIEKYKMNEYFKNFIPGDGILLPHNQRVYSKIIKGLTSGNKVLFEQATGTGKSYLILKFLLDHAKRKRVLFVSSSNVIKDSFINNYNNILGKDYCDLDTCLYQGLKGVQDNQYDIIIFDEVHRMGAKIWGPNSEILMKNNPNAIVLGMTATLDRPDCVDVRKYFDNKEPVSRLTLADALEKGILPKPDYTLAKVNFDDDNKYIDSCIKDFKDKLKNAEGEEKSKITQFLTRLKKAKQAIAESNDIVGVFSNGINTDRLKQGKFIVFCPAGEDEDENNESIHKMKTIMKESSKWFSEVEGVKKIKKYSVYAKLGAKKNSKILKAFEKDDTKALKLLFSINMLNEGMHIDDVDGLIMLRGTTSRIIYLQQLGRALSVGYNAQPKVFDLVANLNYIDVAELRNIVTDINKNNFVDKSSKDKSKNSKNNLEFKLTIENIDILQLIDNLKSNIFEFNHNSLIRPAVKQLVTDYNEFVTKYGKQPRRSGILPGEFHLYDRLRKFTNSENINDQEKTYLIDNGFKIKDKSDNIRPIVKRFVKDYIEYIAKYGQPPRRSGKNNEEIALYMRVNRWTNPENLNDEEKKYFCEKGIPLRQIDDIRPPLKQFVREYNEFVAIYGRPMRNGKRTPNEKFLYHKWVIYTNSEKVNKAELKYLEDNGVEVRIVKKVNKPTSQSKPSQNSQSITSI